MRTPGARVLAFGLIVAGLVFLGLWRFTTFGRRLVSDFLSPFHEHADAFAGDPEKQALAGRSKAELVSEVAELRAELQEHRGADLRAAALARENEDLRGLLKLPERTDYDYVACRVVTRDPAAGGRRLRISRGSKAGIRPGQAVLAGKWLLGRVLEASEESALVITISDPNCKVPARLVGLPAFGVLMGEGEERWKSQPYCLLKHLPRDLDYQEGTPVVSSPFSEDMPPDLPIGVLEPRGKAKLVLTVDQLYKNAWVKPGAFKTKAGVVVVLIARR